MIKYIINEVKDAQSELNRLKKQGYAFGDVDVDIAKNADPTWNGNPNKVGDYFEWLIKNSIDDDNVKLAKSALGKFDMIKKAGQLESVGLKSDIFQYDAATLFNVIGQLPNDLKSIMSPVYRNLQKFGDAVKEVYSDGNWFVFRVYNWAADRYLGSNSSWCTVGSRGYFNQYGRVYYIIIPSDSKGYPDVKSRYRMQFHYEDDELYCCDLSDKSMDIEDILDVTKDYQLCQFIESVYLDYDSDVAKRSKIVNAEAVNLISSIKSKLQTIGLEGFVDVSAVTDFDRTEEIFNHSYDGEDPYEPKYLTVDIGYVIKFSSGDRTLFHLVAFNEDFDEDEGYDGDEDVDFDVTQCLYSLSRKADCKSSFRKDEDLEVILYYVYSTLELTYFIEEVLKGSVEKYDKSTEVTISSKKLLPEYPINDIIRKNCSMQKDGSILFYSHYRNEPLYGVFKVGDIKPYLAHRYDTMLYELNKYHLIDDDDSLGEIQGNGYEYKIYSARLRYYCECLHMRKESVENASVGIIFEPSDSKGTELKLRDLNIFGRHYNIEPYGSYEELLEALVYPQLDFQNKQNLLLSELGFEFVKEDYYARKFVNSKYPNIYANMYIVNGDLTQPQSLSFNVEVGKMSKPFKIINMADKVNKEEVMEQIELVGLLSSGECVNLDGQYVRMSISYDYYSQNNSFDLYFIMYDPELNVNMPVYSVSMPYERNISRELVYKVGKTYRDLLCDINLIKPFLKQHKIKSVKFIARDAEISFEDMDLHLTVGSLDSKPDEDGLYYSYARLLKYRTADDWRNGNKKEHQFTTSIYNDNVNELLEQAAQNLQ